MGEFDVTKLRQLIEPSNACFSLRGQCKLLGISRSGLYYEPKPLNEEDLFLMRAIDEEYTKHPYYGRRRMTVEMLKLGFFVGQKKVRTTMRVMGLEPIYPKPNLSKACREHKKFPYLLGNVEIYRPNQVWSGDITYIPLLKGFAYLFAIIDWFSRYVITWQISNTLDTEFCLEAFERAVKQKKPEIFNTDQGVQFTCKKFTDAVEQCGVKISMDGKGRALDNVMVERLWRSVKYENVYPRGYEQLKDLQSGLTDYFCFYNEKRPHQGLGYRTPIEIHYA